MYLRFLPISMTLSKPTYDFDHLDNSNITVNDGFISFVILKILINKPSKHGFFIFFSHVLIVDSKLLPNILI